MKEKKGFFKYFSIEPLLDSLTAYLDAKVKLMKLELKEELSEIIIRITYIFILFVLAQMIVLFASLTLAAYINTRLDSRTLGFAIVGLIYASIFLILILLQKNIKLKSWLSNAISKILNTE